MLDAAIIALENLFSCPCVLGFLPVRLEFLFLGVLMGLTLGAIPGLGGLVGLAILLPFTYKMDPIAAMAIMIGLLAVTSTSDTIPSVLFAIRGPPHRRQLFSTDIRWRSEGRQGGHLAPPTWRRCSEASSAPWSWPCQSLFSARWSSPSALRSFS